MIQVLSHSGFTNDTGIVSGFKNDTELSHSGFYKCYRYYVTMSLQMIQELSHWLLQMIQVLSHSGFTNDTGIVCGLTNDTEIVSRAFQMIQEVRLALQMIQELSKSGFTNDTGIKSLWLYK